MRFLLVAAVLFLGGCSLFKEKNETIIFRKEKVQNTERKVFWSPCITLGFIDEHYPEKLVEIIRIYDPKVSPDGAAQIVALLLKKDNLNNFKIQKDKYRRCNYKDESGVSLRVIEIRSVLD